jgi:hypothetical protein
MHGFRLKVEIRRWTCLILRKPTKTRSEVPLLHKSNKYLSDLFTCCKSNSKWWMYTLEEIWMRLIHHNNNVVCQYLSMYYKCIHSSLTIWLAAGKQIRQIFILLFWMIKHYSDDLWNSKLYSDLKISWINPLAENQTASA